MSIPVTQPQTADGCRTIPSWSAGLNDAQRLGMIIDLVNRISLEETRFVLEVLRSKEAAFTSSRVASPISNSGIFNLN